MLSHALSAGTAAASGPLGGQPLAVAAAPAVVQQATAPAVQTARTTVAAVRETAERSAVAPVVDVPEAVVRETVATVAQTSPSPQPTAAQRHTVRHRRGGGTVARAASAHPAHPAKHHVRQRAGVTEPALPVIDAAVAGQSAPPRTAAPHRPPPTGSVASAQAPEPGATSSTTASGAGTSAGSAAAMLALLALLTLASPRLGARLRLRKGWVPTPPLLALLERPG